MIRVAEPTDLARVVALEADCLGADAWSETLIEQGLRGLPTVDYLVAVDAGEVLGYAATSLAGDVAELQRVAVDASCRRGGHGTALLDEAVRRARASGADRMLLEVREDNAAALGFYAARDFVEIDRRPRYYRDGATALVLRLSLGPSCGGRR